MSQGGCSRTNAAIVEPQGIVEAAAVAVTAADAAAPARPSAVKLPAASPTALLTPAAASLLRAARPARSEA